MQQISVGASNHIDMVKNRLVYELKVLETHGLKYSIKEKSAGKYVFLSCKLTEGLKNCSEKDALNLFRHYIAETLTDLILGKWKNLILKDIIRENYYYLSENERQIILKNALSSLEDCSTGSVLKLRKKSLIFSKLKEFLNGCDQIVIDGFIRFRLKEYTEELQEAADKAVDDFLMEREYKEFIELLKYFVDIQDSKMELVNIVMKPQGTFKLYDGQEESINNTYLDDFVVDLIDSEINYEDLLISALITLAPGEIIFHPGKSELPATTLETVKSIFPKRVSICEGCKLCKE